MTTQTRPLPLSSSQGYIACWDWEAAAKDLAEESERSESAAASKESRELEAVVEDDAEMRYWSGRGEVSMVAEEEEEDEEEEEEIEIGSGPRRLFTRHDTSTSVHFELVDKDQGSTTTTHTTGMTRKSTDMVSMNLDEPPTSE